MARVTATTAEMVLGTIDMGSGAMMDTMYTARVSTVGRPRVVVEVTTGIMEADTFRDRPGILLK